MIGKDGSKRLDVEVEASGFSRKMAKELEAYMKEHGVDGDAKEVETSVVGTSGSEEEDGNDDQEEDGDKPLENTAPDAG